MGDGPRRRRNGEAGLPLLGTRRTEDVILRRKVGGLLYSVTASVFFQANDFMVSELAALVQELSADKGHDCALDLFSGVGLFSLPLARQFGKVMAVESSPAASRLCAANASAAGFGNIQVGLLGRRRLDEVRSILGMRQIGPRLCSILPGPEPEKTS